MAMADCSASSTEQLLLLQRRRRRRQRPQRGGAAGWQALCLLAAAVSLPARRSASYLASSSPWPSLASSCAAFLSNPVSGARVPQHRWACRQTLRGRDRGASWLVAGAAAAEASPVADPFAESESSLPPATPPPRQGLASWLTDPKKREKLAAFGTAGMISYWAVKVFKHMIMSSLAWYLTSVRTGALPTTRWPTFVSVYASLYLAATPLQPVKFALVAAMTPATDRFAAGLGGRMGISKGKAFLVLLLAGSTVAAAAWAAAVMLAGFLAGVPIW